MTITASEGYYHSACELPECERHYCQPHRLLWRDCETAEVGFEGDRDVPGGTREVFELGDCPQCTQERVMARLSKMETNHAA